MEVEVILQTLLGYPLSILIQEEFYMCLLVLHIHLDFQNHKIPNRILFKNSRDKMFINLQMIKVHRPELEG